MAAIVKSETLETENNKNVVTINFSKDIRIQNPTNVKYVVLPFSPKNPSQIIRNLLT